MTRRIYAHTADGQETYDVTEAVQIVYDAMHGYMGMASGSLDKEEWDAVLHLAQAADFPDYADLKNRRELELRQEEERRERRERLEREQAEARERGRQAALNQIAEEERIAAELRHREPHLAGYDTSSLYMLHLMRQQGRA